MKNFLNNIAAEFPDQNHDACIIANMHALPFVGTLFEVALNKGFQPENILFIGKPYSTIGIAKQQITDLGIVFESLLPSFPAGQLVLLHNQLLKDQLANWCPSRQAQDFILLDSGGYLTKEFDLILPDSKRISIQLTSSGSRMWPMDTRKLVDLGRLDAKKSNESFFIAQAIYTEIKEKISNFENRKICVIGNGAIGQNLSHFLTQLNITCTKVIGTENPTSIRNEFDVIIGATGYDISALAAALSDDAKHVDFISCGSWDTEFRELLLTANTEVNLQSGNHGNIQIDNRITIHNGGCPINFNRKNEIEPENGIAITRGLTLSALLGRTINDRTSTNVQEAHRFYYT